MYLLTRLFFVIAMLAVPVTAHAAEFEKNIMTGGPSGTYIQIGRDIAKIGAECGMTLNVLESAGSLENFIGVRNRRNTQFGIVQSDVLEYLRTFAANDSEIQQAVRGVRIMFPLYNEEIHLLAGRDIVSIRDLAGKRVGVGVEDSGTYLTASLVLDIMRVSDAERKPVGASDSLEMLLKGELDAFFYVAGAPAKLFADERIDGSKYHLVPLEDAPLKATYTPATVPPATYSWQQDAVPIIAVKAVLMTYDYDTSRNIYHRQSCKAVSDYSNLILTRLDELKADGHPKWSSVDLTELPPDWQVGVCVKTGMALDYDPGCAAAGPATAGDGDSEYLDLLRQRLKKGSQ